MKRALQLYTISVGVHIILVVLYFATERFPIESNGFAAPGLFSWVVFPLVFVVEDLFGASKSGGFYAIALLCNTLGWAAVVFAIAFSCRIALSSGRRSEE